MKSEPWKKRRSQSDTTTLSPSERILRARIAAHASWARTPDRAARTRAARQALWSRFEREVDPESLLDPAERARRAEHAMRAHMSQLALRSAQARRMRKS